MSSQNYSSALACVTRMTRVTDCLFVCGAQALRTDRLRQKHITTIVNVTLSEAADYQRLPMDLNYIHIRVEDEPTTDLSFYFDSISERIESTKCYNKGKTLIYCGAGVSRSVTLCIAYLVKCCGYTLREAYFHIKRLRPIIRPNIGFWRQLIAYEQRIRGSTSVRLISTTGGESLLNDTLATGRKGSELPDVYFEAGFNGTAKGAKNMENGYSKNNDAKNKGEEGGDDTTTLDNDMAWCIITPSWNGNATASKPSGILGASRSVFNPFGKKNKNGLGGKGQFYTPPCGRRYGAFGGHPASNCGSDISGFTYSSPFRSNSASGGGAGHRRHFSHQLMLPGDSLGMDFGAGRHLGGEKLGGRRPLGSAPGYYFKPGGGGGGSGRRSGNESVFGTFTAFCDSFVPGL